MDGCCDITCPIDDFLGCAVVGDCLEVGLKGLMGDAGDGAGVDADCWLLVVVSSVGLGLIGIVFSSLFAAFDSTRCFNPFI